MLMRNNFFKFCEEFTVYLMFLALLDYFWRIFQNMLTKRGPKIKIRLQAKWKKNNIRKKRGKSNNLLYSELTFLIGLVNYTGRNEAGTCRKEIATILQEYILFANL